MKGMNSSSGYGQNLKKKKGIKLGTHPELCTYCCEVGIAFNFPL